VGKLVDLTGYVFGKLTVISKGSSKKHKLYWKCKCFCGEIKEVRGDSLQKGSTTTCGCIKRPNLVGKVFGRLIVIALDKAEREQVWKCLCKCGNETKVNTRDLHDGHSKSCGCLRKEKPYDVPRGDKNHKWKGGLTPMIKTLRASEQGKKWTANVLRRSNYTCFLCKQKEHLEAHHKVSFAAIIHDNNIQTTEEALRCKALWRLKNGIALCKKCHHKLHHIHKYRTTIKPWGAEILFEVNDKYAVKQLVMWAGQKCSLQRHIKKQETFVLLTGRMLFTHKDKQYRLKTGAFFTIKPGEVHRMEALTDIVYLECSTPELDDVVRIQDEHGRITVGDL
jgi:mannose-6-phosphate isomerase-like protein (cupin superfamily)